MTPLDVEAEIEAAQAALFAVRKRLEASEDQLFAQREREQAALLRSREARRRLLEELDEAPKLKAQIEAWEALEKR